LRGQRYPGMSPHKNKSMNNTCITTLSKRALVSWIIFAALILAIPAEAQQLKYQNGGFEVWTRLSLASQIAMLDTDMTTRDYGIWRKDASIRFNARWIDKNALTYGLRIEYDADTHAAEELQRDEIYLYFVGDFGRMEIGEQDGPADVLAFRAPIIGLGQIRGDFSRYVGRRALLSAYDTGDAAKLVYLTPPTYGWRFGFSYAPEQTRNLDARRARDRTRQRNAMEFGAQYQKSSGGWVGGISGGYVTADADPLTERANLDSWSIGSELRHDRFTFGTAYVWRGDSNLRIKNYNQEEVNIGVSWRGRKWRAALSGSRTTSSRRNYDLLGIGISIKLNRWFNWRSDLVQYNETTASNNTKQASILLTELELRI